MNQKFTSKTDELPMPALSASKSVALPWKQGERSVMGSPSDSQSNFSFQESLNAPRNTKFHKHHERNYEERILLSQIKYISKLRGKSEQKQREGKPNQFPSGFLL